MRAVLPLDATKIVPGGHIHVRTAKFLNGPASYVNMLYSRAHGIESERDMADLHSILADGLPNLTAQRTDLIESIIRAVRTHLGMPIAFLAEFVDHVRVFRYVDSALDNAPIKVGDSEPLAASYCQRVVDGRLPQVIQNAFELPAALELSVTTTLPIGSHMSVPIRLANGRLYGTFCCFSHVADRSLNARDLNLMAAFAEIIAHQLDLELEVQRLRGEIVERVRNVMQNDELAVVYQPIMTLEDTRVVGFECLSRFPGAASVSPDRWFADAAEVGLGADLELFAVRKGLEALNAIQDAYLAINISPATIMTGQLQEVLSELDEATAKRVVLEITEHALIADYDHLRTALAALRARSLRIAVDDAGAGFSTMRHIIELRPDLIKLDASLTKDIDGDPNKRAMVLALVSFARQTNSGIIAEGVETAQQKHVLQSLDVKMGQGYLFARPMPLADAKRLISAECSVAPPVPCLHHD